MYITAQPYKCLKCGHTFSFTPHDDHPAPMDSDRNPVCPVCWDAFLKTVGIGYCTVEWTKAGSNYDAMKRKEQHEQQTTSQRPPGDR